MRRSIAIILLAEVVWLPALFTVAVGATRLAFADLFGLALAWLTLPAVGLFAIAGAQLHVRERNLIPERLTWKLAAFVIVYATIWAAGCGMVAVGFIGT